MAYLIDSETAASGLAAIDFTPLLRSLLILLAAGLIVSVLLAIWVLRSVRRINIPADAGFFTALRSTPFLVVLLLDVLDFSLDFLSAPIAWPLLGHLGLTALREVTIIEELIPGTQFIPTMTLAWIAARIVRSD